jgi:hypothetical protein
VQQGLGFHYEQEVKEMPELLVSSYVSKRNLPDINQAIVWLSAPDEVKEQVALSIG